MNDLHLAVVDPPADLPGEVEDLARDLRQRVSGEIRFGHHDRMLYATDASIYQSPPIGVVVPRDLADVRAVVEICAAHGAPLLSRGGGTSLAGQVVNAAIIIDFSRWMTDVVTIDASARTARVEPGIVLDDFNRALARHGLRFGPDVATSTHATVGGMIGNNSAGAHSLRYGRTVDHVSGLDALLADGTPLRFERGASARDPRVAELTRGVASIVAEMADEIRDRFARTPRRGNGYNLDLVLQQLERGGPAEVNLASLVCGSEGTLAVTTEATVGLVPAPAVRGLSIVAFAGVDAALRRLGTILDTMPAAVELIDDVVIDLARGNAECRRFVELLPSDEGASPGAVLYVEYFGEDDEDVESQQRALARALGSAPISHYRDPAAMHRAWTLRRSGEPLLHGMPGARKPITFIEDLAVSPARLPDFVTELRGLLERHGTRAAYYAHASVGCLHVRPLIDLRESGDRDAMESILSEATDLVRRYGGALSGEHGDGRLRSPYLERFYGPRLVEAFRRVKALFDPEHRLNPGNIVQPERVTAHLRMRPGERDLVVPKADTFYRYVPEHGFGEAVERCNGAGVCRKTRGGVMCPSYRVTRDERHATRGRGNALRLAITGQLDETRWRDEETLATLELCLSCKACKSECPSNVDIAKLKSEYLAQGYRSGRRVPLAHQLFARVRTLNRWGARAPSLANTLAGSPFGRALGARVLGLDPSRSMPTFETSLMRRAARRGAVDGPTVVLLADCFTAYTEVDVGLAAVEVLEWLGYHVIVADAGCCGRPAISLGLLDLAQSSIQGTARRLRDIVEDAEPVAVLSLEPSCASALVDDWLDLDLTIAPDTLRGLADRVTLAESFVAERWDAHPRPLDGVPPGETPVLLHGHCHQRALWGVDPTAALLHRLAGSRASVLDAGCCGMAGAFGYEREHAEISRAIGELELIPALRAEPKATIVAPGTSCRHQIRDLAGRRALHPMEWLASACPEATSERKPR